MENPPTTLPILFHDYLTSSRICPNTCIHVTAHISPLIATMTRYLLFTYHFPHNQKYAFMVLPFQIFFLFSCKIWINIRFYCVQWKNILRNTSVFGLWLENITLFNPPPQEEHNTRPAVAKTVGNTSACVCVLELFKNRNKILGAASPLEENRSHPHFLL